MSERFHSQDIHNKNLVDVAHQVIQSVGVRPFGMDAATRWEQQVEAKVLQLYERYKADWDRAFMLDEATNLTKKVGAELAERELKATQQPQPRPVVGGVAGLAAFPTASPAAAEPERPSSVETILSPSAVSTPVAEAEELELAVANQIEGDRLPMALPVRQPAALLRQPTVNLGVGLLIGFVVGACVGRYLFPHR